MNKAKYIFKKTLITLLIIVTSFSFLFLSPKKTYAMDVIGGPLAAVTWAWDKTTTLRDALKNNLSSVLYHNVLRTALQKIAYDAAVNIASGDWGQGPLFKWEDTKTWLENIADEAAGQYLEDTMIQLTQSYYDRAGDRGAAQCENIYLNCVDRAMSDFDDEEWEDKANQCVIEKNRCLKDSAEYAAGLSNLDAAKQVNVCRPSSPSVQLAIGIGLAETARPRPPNCTASEMLRNWGDEIKRMYDVDWDDKEYLDKLSGIFHPSQSDTGIAYTLHLEQQYAVEEASKIGSKDLMIEGRWLEERDIAGNLIGTPDSAQDDLDEARQSVREGQHASTGNPFVDAANVFINTLAHQAFQNLMAGTYTNIIKGAFDGGSRAGDDGDTTSSTDSPLTNPEFDPSVAFSNVQVGERIQEVLGPAFSRKADYNVALELAMCPDPDNPGPTDCVIDNSFMQGILDNKTIIEAVEDNLIRGDWLLTNDNKNFQSAYTARSISILRKHRILPLGWEVAVNKIAEEDRHATVMDLISCFDPNDDYNTFSDSFNQTNKEWCEGLVDPYWLLKAPLSYCAKQGYGSQIISKQVVDAISDSFGINDTPSSLSVSRAENYCADELSCIVENFETGDCLSYGYCNEEKRIWLFDGNSCPAYYNTCTAFINQEGKRLSFLENTLDYGICNQDNAGCRKYYLSGSYSLDNNKVEWFQNDPLAYFNRNLNSCSSQNEGCDELMRVNFAWGSNLIMGADFAYDEFGSFVVVNNDENKINNYWPISGIGTAEIIDGSDVDMPGQKVLKFETFGDDNISLYSNEDNSLLPNDFSPILGQAYNFSIDVYIDELEIDEDEELEVIKIEIGDKERVFNYSTNDLKYWRRLNFTYYLDPIFHGNFSGDFKITFSGKGEVYLARPMFELSSWYETYSNYGRYKIYQKLIPPYLANVCYENYGDNFRLKEDAPSFCLNYARECSKDEAGCLMLNNLKNNFSVPGRPAVADYCPGECLNYDVYVARPTHFYSSMLENLIPENSERCSADVVGCSEFTNLDDIASGGERKEYYSVLRHCIKPDPNKCANFYTWQGDDENGYQLRVMILENDGGVPKLTSANDNCSEDIFNLSPWEPGFNPDCREFYNQSGEASYKLMSKVITCSENCHTYRMTERNVDYSLNEASCSGDDKHWDNSKDECYVCKNNGVWSSEHNSCIYQAIPNQGRPCNANMVGCREYSGSYGSNVRVIAGYDFNTGYDGWEGNCGPMSHSNNSVSQNGKSLRIDNQILTACASDNPNSSWEFINDTGAGVELGYSIRQGRAYSVQILARATNDMNLEMALYNNLGESAEFEVVEIKAGDWQVYTVNLESFDLEVTGEEVLFIKQPSIDDTSLYIDNLTISEISDRYYLIKDTSQIPDECYYDVFEEFRGPDYNLGCSLWRDHLNSAHNLRKISTLCDEDSVGCETMIKTNNQTDWRSKEYCNDDGGEEHCLEIERDRIIYAKYDRTKACAPNQKGCTLMGQASLEEDSQVESVYRINNPDNYDNLLCSEDSLGCSEWREVGGGFQYFIDPGDDVCIYRQSSDEDSNEMNWYKKTVKKCELEGGGFGEICSSDDDCPGELKCVVDEEDHLCNVSYFNTIGLGGINGRVPTPNDRVGLCSENFSTCTEYIDPVSQFSSNLVLRGNWSVGKQDINLIPNTLYLLTSNNGPAQISFSNNAREFDLSLNEFSNSVSGSFSVLEGEKLWFHSQVNGKAEVEGNGAIVRPVIINYQLKRNVDYGSCDIVNFNNGCILFNERSFNGSSGLSSLRYDAFLNSRSPKKCEGVDCLNNANQLIKVKPERVCSRWLDCRTYAIDEETGEKICYNLGECTHLNDSFECTNFIEFDLDELSYNNTNISNITGYSLLDKYYIGDMYEVGVNSDFHFTFESFNQALHCRRDIDVSDFYDQFPWFESSQWDWNGPLPTRTDCTFDNNIISDSLILEPKKATTDYPAEGRGYLKVLTYHQVSPHSENTFYSLDPNEDYYINYLLNTKDARVNARIILYDDSNSQIVWTTSTSAHNGWERKVHKIQFPPGLSTKNLQLYLTADINNFEERYVYFDDIHIEPVLKVADNKYIAKECRLYPESGALSCSSIDENVVKHGLEGYCLERDPLNNNVCLTWYPADEISSSQLGQTQKLGYQGPAPLYYCAEADGEFELLEKRVATFQGYGVQTTKSGRSGSVSKSSSYSTYGTSHGITIGGNWMRCYKNADRILRHGVRLSGNCCEIQHDGVHDAMCGGDDNYVVISGWDKAGEDTSRHRYYFCVPRVTKYPPTNTAIRDDIRLLSEWKTIDPPVGSSCSIQYRDVWATFDGLHINTNTSEDKKAILRSNHFFTSCENQSDYDGYFDYRTSDICKELNEYNNYDPPIAIYEKNHRRSPKHESGLKFIYHNDSDKIYNLTCNQFVQVVDPYGINKAWTSRVSHSAEPQLTPNFMSLAIAESNFFDGTSFVESDICVFDGNHPNTWHCEQDKLCNSDPNCIWSPTYGWENESGNYCPCNDVKNDGCYSSLSASYCEEYTRDDGHVMCNDINYNYCDDITNSNTCDSSHYCRWIHGTRGQSDHFWIRYGRLRSSVPYGAATLPSDFDFYSSPKIKLKNQFSNNEDLLAGRPYGCIGSGCENIGQCSLNPNVYCILSRDNNLAGTEIINSNSCARGGYGECLPMWYGNYNYLNAGHAFFDYPLKSIFLKSFGSFRYNNADAMYIPRKGYNVDYEDYSNMPQCPGNSRKESTSYDNFNDSFCAVYPRIDNVKLYSNDGVEISYPFNINEIGLYYLEFNTFVDIEQLPLKYIKLDWGGSVQYIVNQDHSSVDPHRFYHYYSETGPKNIEIEIGDNWGFWGVWN